MNNYRIDASYIETYNNSLNVDRFYNKEKKHPYRNSFQRDRDRILYSKEFRRLSGKTQVFVSGYGDHIRTRLTHTLEVAQIASTISRSLGFDEDLTEAIAYGHDVGHTPFGHAGERALNCIMNGCYDCYGYNKEFTTDKKGFKHNLQSYRVVTELEKISDEYIGLNLTKSTIWGILNHSSKNYTSCDYKSNDGKNLCSYKNSRVECREDNSLGFYSDIKLDDIDYWSFEACIVAVADEIAQRHHDIEDGIYSDIIDKEKLSKYIKKIFKSYLTEERVTYLNKFKIKENLNIQFYNISRLIVDIYTTQYIMHTHNKINEMINNGVKFNRNDIYKYLVTKNRSIHKALNFSDEFSKVDKKLKNYLKKIILNSEIVQSMDGKATFIIRRLFKAYVNNPQQLPSSTLITVMRNYDPNLKQSKSYIEQCNKARVLLRNEINKNNKVYINILFRTICDHIAGMTDQFALQQYRKLYETP